MLLEGNCDELRRIDHLGVEVEDTAQATTATSRLTGDGLATDIEENTTCCYGAHDKLWVTGSGGERWEVCTVLADARPDLEGQTIRAVDCDQTAYSCQASETAQQNTRTDLALAPTSGCC